MQVLDQETNLLVLAIFRLYLSHDHVDGYDLNKVEVVKRFVT